MKPSLPSLRPGEGARRMSGVAVRTCRCIALLIPRRGRCWPLRAARIKALLDGPLLDTSCLPAKGAFLSLDHGSSWVLDPWPWPFLGSQSMSRALMRALLVRPSQGGCRGPALVKDVGLRGPHPSHWVGRDCPSALSGDWGRGRASHSFIASRP